MISLQFYLLRSQRKLSNSLVHEIYLDFNLFVGDGENLEIQTTYGKNVELFRNEESVELRIAINMHDYDFEDDSN